MELKSITLAGRAFPVPPLALGQIKIVVPLILKLRALQLDAITAENMNDLSDICYIAAAKGTPGLARSDFEALHITADEMLNAHPVIALQAGMVFSSGEAAGEPKPAT